MMAIRSTPYVFVLAALTLAAPPATAQQPTEKPFLWRIETDPPSFLYGTIHLPDKRVTTLPKVVEEALDYSDAFFGELALDPELQMQLAPKMMLPPGQNLKKVLPEAMYKRLEAYCASKGVPAMAFAQLKPWALGSQLGMLDYMMDLQMGAKPLDQMLYDRAQEAGKQVGGLEKPEEQLAVFESLTMDEQIEQLGHALDQLEEAAKTGKRPTEDLVLAWLKGDAEAIEAEAKKEFKDDDAVSKKLYQLLLVDRNVRMADRIDARLKEGKTSYFFAVGALHHPGEQGIVALLQAKGYKISRLTAKDAGSLPARARPARGGMGDDDDDGMGDDDDDGDHEDGDDDGDDD